MNIYQKNIEKEIEDFSNDNNIMRKISEVKFIYSIGLIININKHCIEILKGILNEIFNIKIEEEKIMENYNIIIEDIIIKIKVVTFENSLKLFENQNNIIDSIYFLDLRSEFDKNYVIDFKNEIKEIWKKHFLNVISLPSSKNDLLINCLKYKFFHFQGFLLNLENIEIFDFNNNLKNFYDLDKVNGNNFTSIFNNHFHTKLSMFNDSIEKFNSSLFFKKFNFFNFEDIELYKKEIFFEFISEFLDCFFYGEELKKLKNQKMNDSLSCLINYIEEKDNSRRFIFIINFVEYFLEKIEKDFVFIFKKWQYLNFNFDLEILNPKFINSKIKNKILKIKIKILQTTNFFKLTNSVLINDFIKNILFDLSGFFNDFFDGLKKNQKNQNIIYFDLKKYLLEFFNYNKIFEVSKKSLSNFEKQYDRIKLKKISYEEKIKVNKRKKDFIIEIDEDLLKKKNNIHIKKKIEEKKLSENERIFYDLELMNKIISI